MLCGGINSHTDRDPAGFNYIRGFPSCLRCLTARGDSWIFSLPSTVYNYILQKFLAAFGGEIG